VLFAGNVKKGGNLKGKPKHEPVCCNCDKPGHIKPNCPELLKKPNDSKAKPKAKESANAATNSDPLSDWEEEGAFGVEEFSDVESLPGQTTSSINDDDNCSDDGDDSADLFSDCGDDYTLEKYFGPGVDWENVLAVQEMAAHVSGAKSSPTKIELIDSKCTHHISPYREDFTSFEEIPPRSFRAANKQRFSAVGMGESTINLPNGADGSKLALTEVLYSPEVSYILVSVGRLNDLGFIMTFGNGKCTICRPDGNIIGGVPKSSSGLYHVEHETDTANAIEFITLDKFHHRMGHVSPEIAHQLITKGFVTGVKLNNSPAELTFCESCIYAKATRKFIPKVCQGECAKEISGEIHSDIWGPAPVATLHGRRYYVSFIDDKTH
jgi:hypothetical protein